MICPLDADYDDGTDGDAFDDKDIERGNVQFL